MISPLYVVADEGLRMPFSSSCVVLPFMAGHGFRVRGSEVRKGGRGHPLFLKDKREVYDSRARLPLQMKERSAVYARVRIPIPSTPGGPFLGCVHVRRSADISTLRGTAPSRQRQLWANVGLYAKDRRRSQRKHESRRATQPCKRRALQGPFPRQDSKSPVEAQAVAVLG